MVIIKLMYRIEYGKQAIKTLRKMPRNTRQRILHKVNALASSPCQAANVKKMLGGENVYRLRVADWRIVYIVEDERLLISIVKIDVRGGIYK